MTNNPTALQPQIPSGFATPADYLAHLAHEGAKAKYAIVTPQILLEQELSTIDNAGITAHILMFREFALAAREMDIAYHCFGAPQCCLITYVMGLSCIDPIRYGLPHGYGKEAACGSVCHLSFVVSDYQKMYRFLTDKYGEDVIRLATPNWCEIVMEPYNLLFGSERILTRIQEIRRLIKERYGKEYDIFEFPQDAPEAFNVLSCEDINMVTALPVLNGESGVTEKYLREVAPTRIEDVMAFIALCKPNTLDTLETFIRRKRGLEKYEYPHVLLENILGETYGLIVYREQVMRILAYIGRLTNRQAVKLLKINAKSVIKIIEEKGERNADGKADVDEKTAKYICDIMDSIQKIGEEFISGAAINGIDKEAAERIFDTIVEVGYHRAPKAQVAKYAQFAYQYAYFKAHYPREYVDVVLQHEKKIDEIAKRATAAADNKDFRGIDETMAEFRELVK